MRRGTSLGGSLVGAGIMVVVACGGEDEGLESSSSGGALADGGSSGGGDAARTPDGAVLDATATDGVKNGTETDVDCGGPSAGTPRCATDRACVSGSDCEALVCRAGACAAPRYDDAVRNGTETDVDCGGDGTPEHACASGKACAAHADCASNGCDAQSRCAIRASCTGTDGATTCLKEDGTTESCCTAIPVPATEHAGSAFVVDKYLATAGRMRAFLTRVDGNVHDWIEANPPAWWDPRWTPWLPKTFNGHVGNDYAAAVEATEVIGYSPGEYDVDAGNKTVTPHAGVEPHPIAVRNVNIASAWAQVGGGIVFDQNSQGCFLGSAESSYGHPTYAVPRQDAIDVYGDDYERWIPQSALDQRPINCTNWPVLAALCAFDGGRLISKVQYDTLYDDDAFATTPATRSTYPWGTPPALVCSSGTVAKGVCCKTNEVVAGVCKTGGGTWTPGAGYDKAQKPHVAGYTTLAGTFTKIGPGTLGFSTNPCPECVDGWVNWRLSYQDPLYNPNQAGLAPAEQARRARDQSYFISVPGTFPKGASHSIGGDRVQDIAGLMFEATLPDTEVVKDVLVTFGNANAGDDIAVSVPQVALNGGSFEGHAVGAAATYNLPTKYGKLSARCVY